MTNNGLSQNQMIEHIYNDVQEIRKDVKNKADKKDVAKLEERIRAGETNDTRIKTVGSVIVVALTALGIYK